MRIFMTTDDLKMHRSHHHQSIRVLTVVSRGIGVDKETRERAERTISNLRLQLEEIDTDLLMAGVRL